MMSENGSIQNVLVTGATGFVGRAVVRELISRGLKPICVVRSTEKLAAQQRDVAPERYTAIEGNLHSPAALREAADLSQAVIHLVGIIIARRLQGQTFERIHVRGTQNVLAAAQEAKIERFVNMSALGSRENAVTPYHQTKWQAEELVRASELDWTIFRPSLIHGPEGEFMQLMKSFVCGIAPPMIPYFGDGLAKLQPVSVKDVAHCLVDALIKPATIHQAYSLGGPRVYSWVQFYNACRLKMPSARRWKPLVSLPAPLARAMARLSAPPMAVAELVLPPLRKFRFDAGQVTMAQEDSVCDHTFAEDAFDIKMRDFEEELFTYADMIR